LFSCRQSREHDRPNSTTSCNGINR
jgi:hypothetical protein